MKRLIFNLALISIIVSSCEVNSDIPGPRGPQGPAGEDGLIGTIFEVNVDFTATNEFKALAVFPEGIEVYSSDVVLAYILKDQVDGVDVWEPLPQTIFYNGSTLLYGYDHTSGDINFFIDGNMDLNLLPATYTDGYVFRVAIMPAVSLKNMDMDEISSLLNATEPIKIATIQ